MATATITSSRQSGHGPETITVRRMDLDFADTPTFWFDDNPFLTAVLSGLGVSFPPGERYFIASVRHFLPQVDDDELRAAVRAFIGQEANHTKEHLAFNEFLESRGYPAKALEDWVARRVAKISAISTPEQNLARTAALEHFTAILAGALIEDPSVAERMSPETARLWVWHAIEEIEHRSVAFDVYERAVGDEGLRRRTMVQVTYIFVLVNIIRAVILLRASGKLLDLRAAAKGMNFLFGRPGIFRKVIPQYLAYYRKGFHPSEHDNRSAVARARQRYLGEQAA